MELICRAVPQPLVITRTDKDTRVHLPPREAIIQNLIAMRLHRELIPQERLQVIKCHIIERRAVAERPHLTADLTEQRLHELRNRHARRNTMRVNDYIRD